MRLSLLIHKDLAQGTSCLEKKLNFEVYVMYNITHGE